MKKHFKITAISLCIILTLLLTGCKAQPTVSDGYPVTVAGITLEQKPSRVICLTQGAVEAVKYFAGEDIIVGVCDGVTTSNNAVSVGTSANVDVEKVISLSCDVVFSNEALSEGAMQRLTLAGVKVAVLPIPIYMTELEEYYSSFAQLLFGTVDAPTKTFNAMQELELYPLAETAFSAVLIPEENVAATPDTVMGRLLEKAGYKNVAEGLNNFAMVDWATVSPAVIFCGVGMKDSLIANPLLASSSAVKSGRVYELDTALLRLPGNSFAQVVADMSNATLQSNTDTQSTSSIGE